MNDLAHQLPTNVNSEKKKETEGFTTPMQDKTPQKMSIAPKRVIPVIFLPGIMGTHLRMSAARQEQLNRDDNQAWRVDNYSDTTWTMAHRSPAERQLMLDPMTTVVDIYEPQTNPTGNPKETADQRHSNAKVDKNTSPLLVDDPPTAKPRKTGIQKARERGWGEVYFKSYGELLNRIEYLLNSAYANGKLNPLWAQVIGVSPTQWQAEGKAPTLDEATLKKITTNCWYPVHALGYNWLQSNADAAIEVAGRIKAIKEEYQKKGFTCEKVIVVTHSMGGLVARALIHPKCGKMQQDILGIVHGVMPAIGAAAAYKRMLTGFEEGSGVVDNVTAAIIGNYGNEVTPVLANASGGLELLPTKAYGNDWLQITQGNNVLKRLPVKGDPYEEIYKLQGLWFNLIRPEWINPARQRDVSIAKVMERIDAVKLFHETIAESFHPLSYAHYCADPARRSFRNVVWRLDSKIPIENVESLRITRDDLQGTIELEDPKLPKAMIRCRLQPPAEPGDQTVPLHSADAQMNNKNFKAVFRQLNYEHQGSYKNPAAIASTLYSIVKIANEMSWS